MALFLQLSPFMRKLPIISALIFCFFGSLTLAEEGNNAALIGYWQNWGGGAAPYLSLSEVDNRYNIINIAFALPRKGTNYDMAFEPQFTSSFDLKDEIFSLQKKRKKILISLGGGTSKVRISNGWEKKIFVQSMCNIIEAYQFDGMDLDLEGYSLYNYGGTIDNPLNAETNYLIKGVQEIMAIYHNKHGKKMMLTMAPETAMVQGGQRSFIGAWGAYLPVINALRDSLDILHVQLYNSGSMYGIDNQVYYQGSADFIIAMTEAVIQGFYTPGGSFKGLPASKVAIGLPCKPAAAGGGYADYYTVTSAVNYLLGKGPQPGNYKLIQSSGYPDLAGMMTWSINWDASRNRNDYFFAQTFDRIFNDRKTKNSNKLLASKTNQAAPKYEKKREEINSDVILFPNPVKDILHINGYKKDTEYKIYNAQNELVLLGILFKAEIDLREFTNGAYEIEIEEKRMRFTKK